MQTLEQQLRAAKVGDEVELGCGVKLTIVRDADNINHSFEAVPSNNWRSDGSHLANNPLANIIRVIPKLEDGWMR